MRNTEMKRKKWIWFLLVMMTPQLFGASGTLLIDRTPPTVYENHASPLNLSAGGERPYSTSVLYKIKDDSPGISGDGGGVSGISENHVIIPHPGDLVSGSDSGTLSES
jgi:hypothetical protein